LLLAFFSTHVQAQVPGAAQIPNPVELPNPPRRPVQLPGSAITLDKAIVWFREQNPEVRAARETLARAKTGAAQPNAVAAAEAELAEAMRRGLLDLKTAFYEAALARLLIYEAEENLGYFDNYINRMQARYEEGMAPESDATKWRMERARVSDAIAELKLAERLARIKFFRLLGASNSTQYGPLRAYLEEAPAAPLPFKPEALVEVALRQRRDISYEISNLSYELWSGIESAYAAAETQRERAVAIKSQQIAQSEYLRGVAATHYNENEAPLIVLLDAQRTRWQARQDYWRALAGYHIRLAELEFAAGQLLSEVKP
jgi:outer membrane protein TolC